MSVLTFSKSFFTRSWQARDADASSSALAAPFKAAYRSLRSIDGIDEFTSLMGQLLPQLGQAIASLTILSTATPFVAVGAMGAVDDCRERFRDTYPDILRTLHEQQGTIMQALEAEGRPHTEMTEIRRLFDQASLLHEREREHAPEQEPATLREAAPHSARAGSFLNRWRKSRAAEPVLQRFSQSAFNEHVAAAAVDAAQPQARRGWLAWVKRVLRIGRPSVASTSREFLKEADKLAGNSQSLPLHQRLARYRLLKQQRGTERTDRDFSVAGAAAMVGMTGGMVVAAGNAIADIAAATAPPASLAAAQAASTGMAIAAGAVFLPSQIAMAAYGGARLATGLQRRAYLRADGQALAARNADLGAGTRTGHIAAGVHEVLGRERRYNTLNFVAYGGVTLAGQTLMASGNALNLSGLGAPVGVALSGVGAPLTIAGAILRAVAEHKQRKYAGDGASTIASAMAHTMRRQHAGAQATTAVDFARAFRQAQAHCIAMQDRVAVGKLDQLVLKILDKEKDGDATLTSDPATVIASRRAAVSAAIDRMGRRRLRSHRSGLLLSDLVLMRHLYTPVNYPDHLFEGSQSDVQRRLLAYMQQQSAASARKLRDALPVSEALTGPQREPVSRLSPVRSAHAAPSHAPGEVDALGPAIVSAEQAGQGDVAFSDTLLQKVWRRTASDFMRMNNPLLRQSQERFAMKRRMTRGHLDQLLAVPAFQEVRDAYGKRYAQALNKQLSRDARFLRREAALDVIQLAHGMNAVARLPVPTVYGS